MECLTCDSNTCKGLTNFVFCDPGQYLVSTTCTTCTAGYECDGMYRKPCPPGTYSAAGASGCKSCAFGTYSDHVQASSCTAVSGTVSIANLPNFGSIECYRNTKPNVGKYACIPNGPESCPVGHFCSSYPLFLSSSIYDVPCPSGFYNPSTLKDKLSDCVPCTAGNFCPLGSSAVTPCPPGHYCLANSYLGDFYPCPAGTFSTATGGTGLISCSTCPVGKWCPEGVS